MHISIQFPMNRAYYEEVYEQSILSNKSAQLFLSSISLVGMLWGLYMIYLHVNDFDNAQVMLGIIILLTGAFSWVHQLTAKSRWLKQVEGNIDRHNEVSWTFELEAIHQKSKFSESVFLWETFVALRETPKGLILQPQKGMLIYIPKASFEQKADIEAVLDRFEQPATVAISRLKP